MKLAKTNYKAKKAMVLLMQACFFAAGLSSAWSQTLKKTNNATFSWFEYEGSDPVYKEINASTDQYLNPILAGFYPDPSICRVGDDYYLVNSSFSFFPGVPIFHSKDLVNWKQIGFVLDRPSQLNLDKLRISAGIYAPTLRYSNGTFYMITTLINNGGNFFVTAKNPAGPWSDPIWTPQVWGIDPSFFFDDDGKAYVINNDDAPDNKPLYNGHRTIRIHELDVTTGKRIGESKIIVNGGVDISKKPIWIEGPHIFKKGSYYYLIAAEGGTGEDHSEVVFRSQSVWGPYIPWEKNPILTQRHLDPKRKNPVTSSGHVDMVETQNGEWWAVFLACRPYEDNFYNTGRETFMMPVKWENDWPVITTGNDIVPFALKKPVLPLQPKATIPLNGNFKFRDEFEQSNLSYLWSFIRTPRENWYDLKSEPGSLKITARKDNIAKQDDQPSFIGRRLQHAWFSGSTAVRFNPVSENDKAGLVAFQNENYYFFLGLGISGGKPVIQLEQKNGQQNQPATVLSSSPVKLGKEPLVYLKIEGKGRNYNFYYATKPNEWILLKDNVDGTILSTSVAGGFVGTYIGLYAQSGE